MLIKKLLSIVYTIWVSLVFFILFFVLYPLIYLGIQNPKWHKFGRRVVRFWSKLFFIITGMWVEKNWKFKPKKDKPYVFVANHFTYLDVALGVELASNETVFVGKSSVTQVPMFGYMFKKLHIAVDRSDKNSRVNTIRRSIKTLKEGKSVFIMPEGGIVSKEIPKMKQPFKDGAFIMAIENQVPIIPVTFLNNYELNPANLFKWGFPKVIINHAICTKGKTSKDIEDLKKQVYDLIQGDLDKYYNLDKTEYLKD
jgi:1-acyl-sn-glycerol-3-phosphate acyltransferase